MPRNSAGTYSLASPPFVPNTSIEASIYNDALDDIASTLTVSLPLDGSAPMTSPLKLFTGAVNNPAITFAGSTMTGFYPSATNETSVTINGTQIAKINASGLTMVGKPITDKNGNAVYGFPIGGILPYAGSTLPSQWLLCYGQAVSQTTYSALYAVVGTTFGNPGGGNFNLPDLRGRGAFGKDNMGGSSAGRITSGGSGITGTTLGATGGAQNTTVAKTNMPNVASFSSTDPTHTHTYTRATTGQQNSSGASGGDSSISAVNTGSSSVTSTWSTGGSGSTSTSLPPLIILNYMIFAGV